MTWRAFFKRTRHEFECQLSFSLSYGEDSNFVSQNPNIQPILIPYALPQRYISPPRQLSGLGGNPFVGIGTVNNPPIPSNSSAQVHEPWQNVLQLAHFLPTIPLMQSEIRFTLCDAPFASSTKAEGAMLRSFRCFSRTVPPVASARSSPEQA